MMEGQREATFVAKVVTHYRLPFHEQVRDKLCARGVRYRLLYGNPSPAERDKGDLIAPDWAERLGSWEHLNNAVVWQSLDRRALNCDLLILGQENKLIRNYLLQTRWMLNRSRPRVALFGHGRNFQSRNLDGPAERWKRFWATRCDWWFAYTEASAAHLRGLGFPDTRITVFDNAIDTSALIAEAAAVTTAEIAATKASLQIEGDRVAIYVGGLYPDKRLEFLVDAAERVRLRVPGFTLLVVGGGVELAQIKAMARTRPWLIVTGPKFGREKAILMRVADLFLMPGLVGLAVLDACAVGVPMVTTAYPWHSPEISYLEDGVNGAVVADWRNPAAYAETVTDLMLDAPRRQLMARAAAATAQKYSINAMATRFANGVLAALTAPLRKDLAR